jgi:cholesterol oxidase
MQSLDNSLTSFAKKGPFGWRLRTRAGTGDPNPDWIPVAHDVARRYAKKMKGDAFGMYADAFNIPSTAHYIGGCVMGLSETEGVIDPYQRLYGHRGLHVVDGSAVSANLGVNPSLTITAQAERAMAYWPNKGEADPRPRLGAPYADIDPVAPVAAVVPPTAPAALRLPIVEVTAGAPAATSVPTPGPAEKTSRNFPQRA